jgi:hypothetical protein
VNKVHHIGVQLVTILVVKHLLHLVGGGTFHFGWNDTAWGRLTCKPASEKKMHFISLFVVAIIAI